MTQLSLDGGKPVRRLSRTKAHTIYKLQSGERVPGCSTICKIGDDQQGLTSWKIRMVQEGVDPDKARDEAADIGSVGHFFIQCYFDGSEPDVSEFSPYCVDIARSAFGKFKDFWLDQGFTCAHSELQLVSHLHRFGGTLDCIAYDRNMKKILLDFKITGGHWPSHLYQLAGYKQLYEETYLDKLDEFAVIRIPKHGEGPADPLWVNNLDLQWRIFQNQLEHYYLKRQEKKEAKQ